MKKFIALFLIFSLGQVYAQPREIVGDPDIDKYCKEDLAGDVEDDNIRNNDYTKLLNLNDEYCVYIAAIKTTKIAPLNSHYKERVIVQNRLGQKSSCNSNQYKNININFIWDNGVFRIQKDRRISSIKSHLCDQVKCFEASFIDGSGSEMICATSSDMLDDNYFFIVGEALPENKRDQWKD